MLKEFSYIKWIQKQLKYHREVFIPSGDDAAGIKISDPSGRPYILVTTDLIVEGVDFHLRRASWVLRPASKTHNAPRPTQNATPFWIGHKALAVSLSDIAAMGGVTDKLYMVATVALRENLSGNFARDLFRGMKWLADKFKVAIIGGDVSSVNGPISVGVTILGVGTSRGNIGTPIRRSGAQIGDAIMVTGKLGGSILGKHLRFIPRLKEARILSKGDPAGRSYGINSMIDISDGLLADLNHILGNHAGLPLQALLFTQRIPISSAAERLAKLDGKSPLQHALFDGEDFELLFTLPMSEANRILKDIRLRRATPISLVGVIQKGSGILLLDKQGKLKKAKPQGYEHFRH